MSKNVRRISVRAISILGRILDTPSHLNFGRLRFHLYPPLGAGSHTPTKDTPPWAHFALDALRHPLRYFPDMFLIFFSSALLLALSHREGLRSPLCRAKFKSPSHVVFRQPDSFNEVRVACVAARQRRRCVWAAVVHANHTSRSYPSSEASPGHCQIPVAGPARTKARQSIQSVNTKRMFIV